MAHRKDYRAISKILASYHQVLEYNAIENIALIGLIEMLAKDMAVYFKEDNQYFNQDKFIQASKTKATVYK